MRSRKIISSLIAVLLSLMALPVICLSAFAADDTNYAAGYDGNTEDCIVFDAKDILTDDQEEKLNELIKEYSKNLEIYIFVYLSDTNLSDDETKYYADDMYDDIFGADTDGVLYYMDLSEAYDGAYDWISTNGKCVLNYTDDIDTIFANLDYYLPSTGETIYPDKIFDAVEAFLGYLDQYSDYSKKTFGYERVEETGKYVYYKNGELYVTNQKPPILLLKLFIIALITGLVVALIFYLVVKSRYKFKNPYGSSNYVVRDQTKFIEKSDTFIRTYQTRTKIESSSGGSRGGGGHHGGGSHGGGGHHR